MAPRAKLGRERHTQLTRERVLLSAVALADEGGLDALTMRGLGDELRVEAMSLYNHVANKEDMLDGMVDLVFAEIGVPSGAVWKTAMRERARAARAALTRHPWAIGLMESRRRPGPATLRHHDAVIGCLRDAGFSLPMAAHVYSLLDSYIYGFALQQTNIPFREPGKDVALERDMSQRFAAGAYPHLTELLTQVALRPGYDYANEFEFGLDVILEAIDRCEPPAEGKDHGPGRGARSGL